MISLQVKGMSCGHCARAVTEAIHEVDPAAQVEVDLPTGRVQVQSQADTARLSAAVSEAGYEVVPAA